MSLTSEKKLKHGIFEMFEDEKVEICELFLPIEKVMLTVDTYTTTNCIPILGFMIHWIDDTL